MSWSEENGKVTVNQHIQFSGKECSTLCAYLAEAGHHVNTLEVFRVMMFKSCLGVLCAFLKSNSTITDLDVSFNIDVDSMNMIAAVVAENRAIQTLHIAKSIMDESEKTQMNEFVTSLAINPTITSLSLKTAMVDVYGAFALSKALRGNTSLQVLDLTNNDGMQSQGAIRLAEGIRTCSSLTALRLGSCRLKEDALERICDVIGGHPNLKEVNLAQSKFSSESSIMRLSRAIAENLQLSTLRVTLSSDILR